MSTSTEGRRPWLAALLAFVYPGLGHFYLRAWFRGFVWLGLALVTAAMSIPESTMESAVTAFENGGFGAMLSALSSVPWEVMVPLLVIRVLNVIDAYIAAIQQSRPSTADSGPTCPECGRDLDEDIDFCQWCTARIEPEEEPEAA